MRWLTILWRNIARRDAVDRDLDAELRATLDLLIAEKIAAGMPRQAAVRSARLELGAVEAIKDGVRDVRAGAALDSLWSDGRWATRQLLRYPLFTLTAALSLAIGIGATTAIFTIANAMLLRMAPGIDDPGGIVDIIRLERDGGPGIAELSYPTLKDVRERTTTLEAVDAYRLQPSAVSLRLGSEAAEVAFATLATNNFFATLRVQASLGRLFSADLDDRHPAEPILVLSHRFWQRRFGGDPTVVGRPIFLNGVSFTVAGVVDRAFRGLSVVDTDIWVPLSQIIAGLDANLPVLDARSLSDGDTPVKAQLRIAATVAASVGLIGLLLAGVGIYGVTAYTVAQRTREIGVRLSLGASRADVIGLVLREGMRLVGFGAALGLLLGLGAGRLLSSGRYGLPQCDPLALTAAVVLLSLVGLIACYVPVRRATRIRAMEALRYE